MIEENEQNSEQDAVQDAVRCWAHFSGSVLKVVGMDTKHSAKMLCGLTKFLKQNF